MEIVYSPEELAKLWKVSTMTIYKLIGQNKLPHFKVGRAYRIPEGHLQTYMQREGNLLPFRRSSVPTVPAVAKYFLGFLDKEPSTQRANVIRVVLFGSFAKGEATKNSDIDVLVLVKKLDTPVEHWLSHLGELAMEQVDYNDYLSLLPVAWDHWEKHRKLSSPLYEEIERDGILLWPK